MAIVRVRWSSRQFKRNSRTKSVTLTRHRAADYSRDCDEQSLLHSPQEQLLLHQTTRAVASTLTSRAVTLHAILLGVGGTIYNTHTLKSFKELGLASQRVKKLASKLHVHSVNFAANLVHTRQCPFQYCYQLSSGADIRPSLQPTDPH